MNKLRQLFVLLLFANLGALAWWHWRPSEVVYTKPVTDPGLPGLVLHHEFLQLDDNKQRLQATACWIIGPYASEDEMLFAYTSLEYIVLDMQHSKNIKSFSNGYELNIPPSANISQAQLIIKQLKDSGISNAHIYEQGPMTLAVSLGQFEQLADAQALQRQVQALGYEVELKGMQSERPEWWIKATLRNQEGFKQWLAEQTPIVNARDCR
jgi:hypothetical protein